VSNVYPIMKVIEKEVFFDMKHGYVRPVTIHDSVNEQKRKINFYTTNITEEQHAKNKKRDQLQQFFNEILCQGDELYITDLCILADSSRHLVELFDKAQQLEQLLNEILGQGDELYITDLCILADSSKRFVELFDKAPVLVVSIYIINLQMLIHAEFTAPFPDVLHAISDFQSDVVKFRTRVGMEESSKKGAKIGRPRRSDENLKNAIDMYMSKQYTLDEIKEQTNISRATLYRHLDQ